MVINVSAIAVTIPNTTRSEKIEKNIILPRLMCNTSLTHAIDGENGYYKPVSYLLDSTIHSDTLFDINTLSIETEFPPVKYSVQSGIGTEVLIDDATYDATDEYNPGPGVVFINGSHGYVFYQKTIDERSEIVYSKTTNGGDSWSSPIGLDSTFNDPTFRSFSVWYDQWTPGNSGDLIHIIVGAAGDYMEMYYNYLDTSDDSSSGAWTFLYGFEWHNAPDGGGAVTVSTEGYIFGALWGRRPGTDYPRIMKYDSSWTDISPEYAINTEEHDHGQLLPLSNGDIICIYEDSGQNNLYSFVYDEETDTWDSSATIVTSIVSGTTTGWEDANWGAVLDPDTYDVYLLLNNDVFANGGDMETWVFSDNDRSWSKKTDVLKNVGSSGDEVKPTYDPLTDTLYAIAIFGTNIYVKNSTDGGDSWGSFEEITTASEDWIVVRTNFISFGRVYAIYFDEPNDDLYGNTISLTDINPPVVNDFGVDDPGNGNIQFWANVTDDLSSVASVKLDLNDILYDMTLNETGYWIYQPSSVVYGDVFTYQIINASDTEGNYLTGGTQKDSITLTYDTVFPMVDDWEYFNDIGSFGTFNANVSDLWGEIDTVLVNVTKSAGVDRNDLLAIMIPSPSGYLNDTLQMDPGTIFFEIIVNDTVGNTETSSLHQGYVPEVNHPPTASNLTLSPDPLYSNDTLTLSYNFSDLDGDSDLGTEIRWYKNSIHQEAFDDEQDVQDFALFKGDKWNVSVRPKDGQDFGELVWSSIIVVQNNVPNITSYYTSPGTPTTSAVLNISYSYYDTDNDEENITNREIEWYKDGQPVGTLNDQISVPSSETKRGDNWHFKMRVHDGTNFSSWVISSNVTIINTAPFVSDYFVSPINPKTGDNLVANYTYSDPDSDSESESYIRWYRNGVINSTYTNQTTVPAAATKKGENWYFTVRPSDGTDYGSLKTASYVTISNTVPSVFTLNITPSIPKTGDILLADYTYDDPDDDPESGSEIIWYKGGILQGSLDSLTVSASLTAKDDEWHFKYRPCDGTDFGVWVSCPVNVTISNTAPTANNLMLTPVDAKTGDELTADYSYHDNDSETESGTEIIWYLNGTLQDLNDSFSIQSGNTSRGDEWHFKVRPKDGIDFGEWVDSPNITIRNTPPVVSEVEINNNDQSAQVDNETDLVASYSFFDADGDDENYSQRVILWYKGNPGELQSSLTNSLTVGHGNTTVGDIWYVNISLYDGFNNSNYIVSPSVSIGQTANVVPVASDLNISNPNPTTIDYLYINYTYYDTLHPESGSMYYWYRNNIHMSQFDGFRNLSYLATAKGEEWHVKVRPRDGIDFGVLVGLDPNVTIGNTPPSIVGLEVSPLNPISGNDLSINYEYNDIDGDSENGSEIIWYLNGTLQDLNDSFIIQSGNTSKGDEWHYKLRPRDGTDFGEWVSCPSNVTIGNTAPSVSSLNINPGNPRTGDALEANYSYFDTDFDSESNSIIRWYRNGEWDPTYNNQQTVSATATSKGENWYFTIQPGDGTDNGNLKTSPMITIANSAPSASGLSIIPSIPQTGQILNASFYFDDPDDDPTSGTEIIWYKTGILQGELNNSLTVPTSYTVKGQEWHFKVRPSDGTSSGGWISLPINTTIANTRPQMDSVILYPSGAVYTTQALVVNYESSDIDHDFITDYRIVWLINGSVEVPKLENKTEVPSNYTKKEDTWVCQVQAFDGEDWSDFKFPMTGIAILNSKPNVNSITITGGETTDDNIVISYNYTDPDGDFESYTQTQISWKIFHRGSLVIPPSTATIDNSWITAGDFVFCWIKPHDGEEFGDIMDSTAFEKGYLIVGNSPPELSTTPNILDSNDTTIFSAISSLHVNYTVTDVDHGESDEVYDIEVIDGLTVGAEYRWYRNDELKTMLDGPLVDSSYIHEGEIWMVSTRPRDRYGDFGNWVNSSPIVIGNSAPSILGFSWTTESPTTIDDLLFSYNYFDHDLDPEWVNMTMIQWYKNGTEMLAVENQTILDHVYFTKNDSIYVIVQSYDGKEYSIPYRSENITIINARPVASNLSINPIISYTTDSLSVNWIYEDLDDDLESTQNLIHWYKNGILESILNDSKYISSANTKRGDIWVVTLQVFDGFNYSFLYESEPITILNSPSTITQVAINGNIEYTYADTFLKADWNFEDPDGDSEADHLIYWFLNNTLQADLTNFTLIPNSDLSQGDTWSFVVQIFDGEDWSLNHSSQVISIVENIVSSHGVDLLPDSEGYNREGYYHLWINASEFCVDNGDIYETRYQITINNTLTLPERVTVLNNGTDTFWVLNYNLLDDLEEDFIAYIDTTAVVTFTALAKIQGNFIVNSTLTSNFTIDDRFAPRVTNVYYEWNDDRNPTNLTFYANLQEFGSIPDDIQVTVYYSFDPPGTTNQTIGLGSIVLQNGELKEAQMKYENKTGENLLYSVTVPFSPSSDVEIHFRIQTEDKLGNKNESAFTHEQLQTPLSFKLPGFDLADLIPLLVVVGVVPAFLIIVAVLARRRQQTRIYRKRQKVKSIEEKLADIFSLRAILCRNMFGVPFYTENFVEERRDGELIAGLTSAMTDFVSQVAQRDISSGEFDVLEREGFNILSYHGEYSTTTLIAETKPSSYIKDKLVEITDQIESKFSRNRLQDSEISGTQEPIKKILYKTLPLGLFKPLIVDEERLKKRKKHFSKDEIKWFEYVKEVPSFIDGQQVFYAMTFITSLTLHGIPLTQAFSFLETCYELDVVRNLTEQERSFFEPVVAVERQQY